MKLKLQNEYEFVKGVFTKNIKDIKKYAPLLKEKGQYNNFERRLTWDCLKALIGYQTITEWYYKYDCNDNHIYALGSKVLKELGVI